MDPAEQGESVYLRESHITDDHIEDLLIDELECLAPIARLHHLMARVSERVGHRGPHPGFVFDDQNVQHLYGSSQLHCHSGIEAVCDSRTRI